MKYVKRYVIEFVIFFVVMYIMNIVMNYHKSIVTIFYWSIGVVAIFAISDYIRIRRDHISKM